MDFRKVIEQIRQKDPKSLFNLSQIRGVEETLQSLPSLEYLGHGIQSICFQSGEGFVVKCCMKRKNSILLSKKILLSTTQDLIQRGFPILPAQSVLYENNTWMVYTQPMCRVMERVTLKFCLRVLLFLQQMIETDLRFSDIYYKNFGTYQNKFVLFDYHEMEHFDTASNFLITNLYSLFKLLGYRMGWNRHQTDGSVVSHWDEIVSNNFGRSMLPMELAELLYSLHQRNIGEIKTHLQIAQDYLKNNLCRDVCSYRRCLKINQQDLIELNYPNKLYQMLFQLIDQREVEIKTVYDWHAAESGAGLKLAQDFPNIVVTLGCHTPEEVIGTQEVMDRCVIYNTLLNTPELKPLAVMRALNREQYDLIIYGRIVLDLLIAGKLAELPRMIRSQVGKVCCLEVPMVGDYELGKIQTQIPAATCDPLISPLVFRTFLQVNRVRVNRCILMDNNGSGEHRMRKYFFWCS
uniref:Uncharacterized protein n=1 Tax=viral metagenome TaxID=1070528 RepID=A0A6C0BLT5_9ZZZZ